MSAFVLSEDAEADLEAIFAFIATDDPRAALRVLDELEGAMQRLAERPLAGHSRHDLADPPLRFWSVYSYLLVYDPTLRPIAILRVLSGYRDVAELLG